MHVTISFDDTSASLLRRIAEALETIASNTAPSPFAVGFAISLVNPAQEKNMQPGKIVKLSSKRGAAVKLAAAGPTQLSDSAPQAIAVFGIDAAGVYGAPLAPGASIVMSMGAPASGGPASPGSFVQDATPGIFSFTDANGVVHTNVQSVASGVFTPSPAGSADVGDAFPIGYVITGGSGDSGSAQFATAVGVETSEVIGLPTT
jgi:hypothetical protein